MRSLIVIWIWPGAYLNCAGWARSAGHALNPAGWLTRMHAEPLRQFELKLLAQEESQPWLLVRFR